MMAWLIVSISISQRYRNPLENRGKKHTRNCACYSHYYSKHNDCALTATPLYVFGVNWSDAELIQ
jgi:hypothetical protein